MKNSRKRIKLILIAILTSAQLVTPTSNAGGVGGTPPQTACYIEIGNAHFSTSLNENQGLTAVKVNAISYCNFTQSNVELTVKIYKVGRFTNYLVANKTVKSGGLSAPGIRIKNQVTYFVCKNFKKSRFFGVASSVATINSKQMFAPPTRSEKIKTLNCGN